MWHYISPCVQSLSLGIIHHNMSRYKPNCQVLLFRMSLWASATSDVMFALTLLIVKMTNLTQLPKANRQTLACKTQKRQWVCYLKHSRSKSFSHILPTLCCIVTSAGTLTLPLLSYCLFIFLSLSLFVRKYQSEFAWLVPSADSHISKVTIMPFVWELEEGEK